jgi:hypothetical protein
VGDTTTVIALPDWHSGEILVPVATSLLTHVARRPRVDLLGTWLTVAACLDAVVDTDLYLCDWQLRKQQDD